LSVYVYYNLFYNNIIFYTHTGRGEKGELDNCYIEFQHACLVKERSKMLAVVMEPRCRDSSSWIGKMGSFLGGSMYVDFTSDDSFDDKMNQLNSKIRGIVQTTCNERFSIVDIIPTSEANHSDEVRFPSESLHGSLKTWLIGAVKIVPDSADTYATIFISNKIGSVARLKKKLTAKPTLLLEWGVDEDDADDILSILVGDSSGEPSAVPSQSLKRNSDGALVKLGRGDDPVPATGGLLASSVFYCGRRMNQCRCGDCDGNCGPGNGCPCDACLNLVAPKKNSDGAKVKLGRGDDPVPATGGMWASSVFYCGRRMNQCRCGDCDGNCGPGNGCP
jgi:hypothetical protein